MQSVHFQSARELDEPSWFLFCLTKGQKYSLNICLDKFPDICYIWVIQDFLFLYMRRVKKYSGEGHISSKTIPISL